MMTEPSVLIARDYVSITFTDGLTATIYAGEPNFGPLKDAVRAGDWDKARELSSPGEQLREMVESVSEHVDIEHGVVLFKGKEMHGTLTERMIEMAQDGFDVEPLALFLENLQENPSYRAVNELYDFLEAGKLPITSDGHFLAYKMIRDDWTDCHTGTMDNSIGAIVEMPRNQVCEDKNRTCSSGLHFCARSYIGGLGYGRLVVVKINPRDVVSIPVDYNNAKGRCCRYEVIQELAIEKPAYLEGSYTDNDDLASVLQVCLDTGETIQRFATVDDASAATNIPAAYISRVLRGDRNSTGGYGWAYEARIDDSELDYFGEDVDDVFNDYV